MSKDMDQLSGRGVYGREGEAEQNCFHARVRGRVQRVGYRVFAREAAARHRISGWVRNLPDGGVEVHAEGEEMALMEFLTELHRGPILSHVADIDVDWSTTTPQYSRFEIRR